MTTHGKLLPNPEGANAQPSLPIAQLVAIAMLAWALVPTNPYGYYVLLRIVICGICILLVVRAYDLRFTGWTWTMGLVAVVYNPVIRIHLDRPTWSAINVVTILILAATIWVLRPVKQ